MTTLVLRRRPAADPGGLEEYPDRPAVLYAEDVPLGPDSDKTCRIAYDTCRVCTRTVRRCSCPGGPKEPPFIQRWREEAAETDLQRLARHTG